MKLQIKSLAKSFLPPGQILFGAKTRIHAVTDISLTLESGESLGIVGESGSGKTTVAKMIAGFLDPDGGSIAIDGRDVRRISGRERSRLVQMVFQDPFASLNPKLLLSTQIEEGMNAGHINEARARAQRLMDDVGLPKEFLSRYPHQLSGGQRQRFAIARALSMEPELLLADEPVSSLDLTVQAQILDLLKTLQSKHRFAQIVISHDLAVIANLCSRVMVMKDGRMVEEGPVDVILSKPQEPYTKRLLAATPRL